MSALQQIFTPELRGKIDAFLASVLRAPPAADRDVARLLGQAGIAIVDTSRTTFLVDARVHEGTLWRLQRLRRQNPPRRIVATTTWRSLTP